MTALKEQETHLDIFTDDKKVMKQLDAILKAKRPGADHEPKVQMGQDDGYTRFYKATNYKGGKYFRVERGFLSRISKVINFTQVEYLPKIEMPDRMEFLKRIIPTLPFKPYKHQLKAFMNLTEGRNNLSIVATGGGKSMIGFLVLKYFWESNIKSILVVPTIGLTSQMKADFCEASNINKKINDELTSTEDVIRDITHILSMDTLPDIDTEYYRSMLHEYTRSYRELRQIIS